MMIKISDYVIEILEKYRVENIFMFAGGGAMHLNDSLGNSKKINYICCLHEQACAMAAEAYARAKNDLGVTIVTTGPGATNTLTGIAAAWIESTPLFVISGQVKCSDSMLGTGVRQMGVQEVDIVSMAKPITKYAVLITNPLKIRFELEKCIYLALNGRKGPVLLDIPLDIQAVKVNIDSLEGYIPEKATNIDISDSINTVVHLLNTAQRPVFYIGAGVRFANADQVFIKLAEKLQIPVLTTWNGMDLIWDEHPLYMGRPGAIGQRAANFVLQNADVLITIGTRLSPLQTGFNYDAFARNAKLVMVDIDCSELEKKYLHPFLKICTDAKLFINALIKSDELELKTHFSWLQKGKEWNQKYPVLNANWENDNQFANSYVLVDAISRKMSSEDIYCGGRAGTCIDTIIHAFKVKKDQRVFATKGLSSMGYGLPASIGAAIAYPNKKIVCVNGDGGFIMNIQELETVFRLKLPIKYFILDNNGYATIVSTQTNVFNKHFVACNPESGLTIGDVNQIASAFGIKTFEITNNDKIESTVSQCLDYDGPVVCKVKVSIFQPIEPRQSSFRNEQGQMQSRPLEDMKPLLDKEELALNMIFDDSNN